MDIRLGTDLVEVARFRRKISSSSTILSKLFSPAELKDREPAHLAGVFAAKEAAFKALGFFPGSWLEIEISYEEGGEPALKLPKETSSKLESYDLSITHESGYALATFVAILK